MSFLLDKEKWISIGKGLLIALGAAAATYLATLSTQMDFGPFTPMIVAGFSVAINYIRKAIEQLKED
jgi:hypothetical protein